MIRTILAAALATLSVSFAATAQAQSNDRLLIVNGNTHRVVYDDGRNDLFCVTRRHVAYYDYFGRPVHRRTIRCR